MSGHKCTLFVLFILLTIANPILLIDAWADLIDPDFPYVTQDNRKGCHKVTLHIDNAISDTVDPSGMYHGLGNITIEGRPSYTKAAGVIYHGNLIMSPDGTGHVTNVLTARLEVRGVDLSVYQLKKYCTVRDKRCYDYLVFSEHVDVTPTSPNPNEIKYSFVAKLTIVKGTGVFENTTGGFTSNGYFYDNSGASAPNNRSIIETSGAAGKICWW